MISETELMDMENLPPEMANSFDRPWHFLGEVNNGFTNLVNAICKCSTQSLFSPCVSVTEDDFLVMDMKAYKFITGDMIEVIVWFGVCETCGRVTWARQGPPFKRARFMAMV